MTTTTPDAPSTPDAFADDTTPILCQIRPPQTADEDDGHGTAAVWTWTPMWRQACGFGTGDFDAVMQNLLRNPNQLSSWLFRADILQERPSASVSGEEAPRRPPGFAGFALAGERTLVRRLIPRNTLRDQPMLQTCAFYEGEEDGEVHNEDDHDLSEARRSLVVYLPHATTAADVPFYHPKVQGVGFLHEWRADAAEPAGVGVLSIHFAFFPETTGAAAAAAAGDGADASRLSRPLLSRVALNLLQTVRKHGEGRRRGYVKRVHHDRLVAQARVQDRYTRLKERHARQLVAAWQETTDPAKHVFEDLAIAAFLMELWADMYKETAFPGFVDVGCGNGLLVHVLRAEGYAGWGFDARRRRSWLQYGNGEGAVDGGQAPPLQERLLLPFFLVEGDNNDDDDDALTHDGRFPPGTFVIANHADELTVWTPLLAALAGCPFLAIPCCSHNFTGARFRAPPPAATSASASAAAVVSVDLAASSTYASFVSWVTGVAEACGWAVELEMLRIPSTRNAGLVGRRRRRRADGAAGDGDGDGDGDGAYPKLTVEAAMAIVAAHGGAHGFADTVAKLAKEKPTAKHS